MTALDPARAAGPATPPAGEVAAPPPTRNGDRRAVRAAARAFRPQRSVPATIVAAVLAVVAILAAVEVISRLIDRPASVLPAGRLTEFGQDNQWDDPAVLTVCGALAALGLLLLLIAIWPARSRVVPLSMAAPALAAGITRRALRHDMTAAARGVPGVTGAAASVGGRRLRVRVDTPLREPAGLATEVRDAVSARLAQLAPVRPPRVSVAVRRTKGVV